MRLFSISVIAIAALFVVLILSLTEYQEVNLAVNPRTYSGYGLLGVIVLLALFPVGKKLSLLPIFSARHWLVIHAVFGLSLPLVFWVHTHSLWPTGLYEQVMALLFYVVFLGGSLGLVLAKVLPGRLSNIGDEIIYERIPDEIHQIRETVKRHVKEAVETSGNDTLSRLYGESFSWFLTRPRFFREHLTGSAKPLSWIRQKQRACRPFLSERELEHLDAIVKLMYYKNRIDANYVVQTVLKKWLYFHTPFATALLVIVAWHVLLVHIYLI